MLLWWRIWSGIIFLVEFKKYYFFFFNPKNICFDIFYIEMDLIVMHQYVWKNYWIIIKSIFGVGVVCIGVICYFKLSFKIYIFFSIFFLFKYIFFLTNKYRSNTKSVHQQEKFNTKLKYFLLDFFFLHCIFFFFFKTEWNFVHDYNVFISSRSGFFWFFKPKRDSKREPVKA